MSTVRTGLIATVRWMIKYLPGTAVLSSVATAFKVHDLVAERYPFLAPYKLYIALSYPIASLLIVSVWDALIDLLKKGVDMLDPSGIEREFTKFRKLINSSKAQGNPYIKRTVGYRLEYEREEFLEPMLGRAEYKIEAYHKYNYIRKVFGRFWKFPSKRNFYVTLSNYDYWSEKPVDRRRMINGSLEMYKVGVNVIRVIILPWTLLDAKRSHSSGAIVMSPNPRLIHLVREFDKALGMVRRKTTQFQVYFHFLRNYDSENTTPIPYALVCDPTMKHFMYGTTDMSKVPAGDRAKVEVSFHSVKAKGKKIRAIESPLDCLQFLSEAEERISQEHTKSALAVGRCLRQFNEHYQMIEKMYNEKGERLEDYSGLLWDISEFKKRFPEKFVDQNRAKENLMEIVSEAAPGNPRSHIVKIVSAIDDIANRVRQDGAETTSMSDSAVREELADVLKNQQLDKDRALFESCYKYIQEYY